MRKQAKLDLLKDLRKMAMGMIHEGAGEEMPEHMQKVMVAAKDKEGLEKGLDKAKEVLSSADMGEHEAEESPEMEASEEECSPDDLEAQIKELQDKLAKMKK